MYPVTGWGYLVGGICALFGMLATGLPIPIIASNFNRYHTFARFAIKLQKRDGERLSGKTVAEEGVPVSANRHELLRLASSDSSSASSLHGNLRSSRLPQVQVHPDLSRTSAANCSIKAEENPVLRITKFELREGNDVMSPGEISTHLELNNSTTTSVMAVENL